MKSIVVIDDKDHAAKQVQFCISQESINRFKIAHYTSAKEYLKKPEHFVFAIFLDFFLDFDQEFGISFLPFLETKILVAFSSNLNASISMKEEADKNGKNKLQRNFAIQKIKSSLANVQLSELIEKEFINEPRKIATESHESFVLDCLENLKYSPEEYLARNIHNIVCFSFDEYEYSSQTLNEWMEEFSDLAFSYTEFDLKYIREKYLTKEEIVEIVKRKMEDF